MPTLTVTTGDRAGEQVELSSDRFTIGRAADSDLALDATSVSTAHCALVQRHDRWSVQDLDSTNGTLLNGTNVREARLRSGDRISIGGIELLYEDVGAADVTAILPAFETRRPRRGRTIALNVAIALATLGAAVWFVWRLVGGG
jgi:pSer/pThr/pTyr-binding forkhead associated (FHA) protein